jgi:hypothetical protein
VVPTDKEYCEFPGAAHQVKVTVEPLKVAPFAGLLMVAKLPQPPMVVASPAVPDVLPPPET